MNTRQQDLVKVANLFIVCLQEQLRIKLPITELVYDNSKNIAEDGFEQGGVDIKLPGNGLNYILSPERDNETQSLIKFAVRQFLPPRSNTPNKIVFKDLMDLSSTDVHCVRLHNDNVAIRVVLFFGEEEEILRFGYLVKVD